MEAIFDFYPLCGKYLHDKFRATRWIHDILNHRGYFETQTKHAPSQSIFEMLYEVIEHYHRPDIEIESDSN